MVNIRHAAVLLLIALAGCSGSGSEGSPSDAASKQQSCTPEAGFNPDQCRDSQLVGKNEVEASHYLNATEPLLQDYAQCSGDPARCRTLFNGALLRACKQHFGEAADCATDVERQTAAERALLGACDREPAACGPLLSAVCAEHFPAAACQDFNRRLDAVAAQPACGGDSADCTTLQSRAQQQQCRVALGDAALAPTFCDLPLPGTQQAARNALLQLDGCTYPLEPTLDIPRCVASIRAQCDLRLGGAAACETYELMVDATLGLSIYCVENPDFCAALVGRVVSFSCHNSIGLALPQGTAFCEFFFPQPPTLPDIPTTPPPRRPRTAAESTPLCLAYPTLGPLCEDPVRLFDALSVDSPDSSRLRAVLFGGIE